MRCLLIQMVVVGYLMGCIVQPRPERDPNQKTYKHTFEWQEQYGVVEVGNTTLLLSQKRKVCTFDTPEIYIDTIQVSFIHQPNSLWLQRNDCGYDQYHGRNVRGPTGRWGRKDTCAMPSNRPIQCGASKQSSVNVFNHDILVIKKDTLVKKRFERFDCYTEDMLLQSYRGLDNFQAPTCSTYSFTMSDLEVSVDVSFNSDRIKNKYSFEYEGKECSFSHKSHFRQSYKYGCSKNKCSDKVLDQFCEDSRRRYVLNGGLEKELYDRFCGV